MKVHELVARCTDAAESTEPMRAVRAVIESWKDRVAEIEQALDYVSGVGGNARQVFYRSPSLTMLKVCFPAGRRTPPHDHGTWAMILLLSGREKNTLYRREPGGLRKAGEVTLERGSILPMLGESVHVAESIGEQAAIGLHVYGGDILELPRRMWHPQSLVEHPLDWTVYESFARIASQAAAAPLAD
ncbi:MAG: cysteine dioxygenase family protein [Burkholderiales bacterium]|nr:cysteine dioxygenase family protein [Burkholderiales bacterium]